MQCLLHGDENEEEVQWRVWRDPRALCHRDGDGEPACERSGFGVFSLSDGVWWGQRHYDDRSRMAVVSSVWCGLFFSTSYQRGIMFLPMTTS